MAESESTLPAHVATPTGSAEPRILSTQILSADVINKLLQGLARRGATALSPWFGPDGSRNIATGGTFSPLSGFLFQGGYGLDTTTLAGTVSLVEETTDTDRYGQPTGRITGRTSNRAPKRS